VQLTGARDAVFGSWFNNRAKHYRKMNQIPDDLGTAVNVQAMVFGNLGETSATGVGFTRNPATGEKAFYGEFLENAQGEDVVAGIRTPHPISDLEKWNPAVYNNLRDITSSLEQHYRDIQDFEFTIQDGTLYMLQTQRQAYRPSSGSHRSGDGRGRAHLIRRGRASRILSNLPPVVTSLKSVPCPGRRCQFSERPSCFARRRGWQAGFQCRRRL
jgi:hypothetical protein